MTLILVRWFGRNIGAMAVSLTLAILVWVSVVITSDPNEECTSPRLVPLELLYPDADLQVLGSLPSQVTVRLRAPHSVCSRMSQAPGAVRALVDLSVLSEGQHTAAVQAVIGEGYQPVRLLGVSPETVTFRLESILSRTLPIRFEVTGEPAPGYTAGQFVVNQTRITVTGIRSLVEKVKEAVVELDLTNAQADLKASLPVQLLDADGRPVEGLTPVPDAVVIFQPVARPGTYRDLIVKVVTTGQEAEGYRLTNISVTPPVVTVFSSDPQIIRDMPGYVETQPIDLNGATDDIERRVGLVLPDNVSVVGERTVTVQVSIAAIESSITLTLPVETQGLGAGLEAQIFPDTVNLIIAGPLPELERFRADADASVFVDLTGLGPGTYTLALQVEILIPAIRVQSVIPPTVEITLVGAPTATATPTGSGTPAPPTATPVP